jgi:hypothetical protein
MKEMDKLKKKGAKSQDDVNILRYSDTLQITMINQLQTGSKSKH